MSDIEDIPVETVAGERPSSAAADRLLLGLAALALLGGLLIAVGNLVGPLLDDPVAAASHTATADPMPTQATPRPTRTERPLREVTLISGEPPELPNYDFPSTYWVQATAPLPVRYTPTDAAVVADVIKAGEVVLAAPQTAEDVEWFAIQDGAVSGWIRVADEDGTPMARVAPVAEGHLGGRVSTIAAGPTGFVAHGWGPDMPFAPLGGLTMYSSDGTDWEVADPPVPSGWGGWAAAWGPSGWLAVSSMEDGSGTVAPWIWESPDGSSWTPVGAMPVAGESFVGGLVANETGYLLALGSPRVERGLLWFSSDGITWQESAPTGLGDAGAETWFGPGGTGVLATDHGFLTWPRTDGPYGPAEIAFSRSGRIWEPIVLDDAPVALLQVAAVDPGAVALGVDEDGRTVAWTGSFNDGHLEMWPAPWVEDTFDGAVITSLVSDGRTATALGYQRDGGRTRAWTSVPSPGWRELAVPEDGFGAIPRAAAAGPGGVVVAGARIGPLSSSPVFWHLRPDERWATESEPVIAGLADPGPDACPSPPSTAFEFMALEAGLAVACHGDASLSLVAWSADCGECWGGAGSEVLGPAWLLRPSPFLLLLPYEGGSDRGWWRQAVLEPGLRWRAGWVDTWLRVTGHFDDAAADGCGAGPERGAEAWWQGPELDVLACRWTFVVTEVEVLGPDHR